MPKVSALQSNFVSGEFSSLLHGRVDADLYNTGLAKCLNYVPAIQGSLLRRPGTAFVGEVKDSTKFTRLIEFEFSTTQAYMIEMGDQYFRFFKDNAAITNLSATITGVTQANPAVVTAAAHGFSNGDRVIISGISGMVQLNNREFRVANVAANTFEIKDAQLNTNIDSTSYTAYSSGGSADRIYEISSTFLEADLSEFKYTQSADVIYFVHPAYKPYKLTRSSHTSWTLSAITFVDGPFLNTNTTSTTLTPSGTTGAITITASSTTGINDNAGFKTTDVGRQIRIKELSTWAYATITGFTSTTVVSATVGATAMGGTAASAIWRLGVWSDTTGFPASVVFHEDRLCFSGPTSFPQRMDGSNSSDYENFAPSATDGTITASHAIAFSFNANDVNAIQWTTSDEKGMLVGAVGGEWVVRPSSQSEALSPTNISAKKATSYGSANLQPVQIGNATIYVQRAGRKVREMTYFYEVDGFRSPDLTELSEHMGQTGFTQVVHQKEPQSIMWGVRSDGVLVAMIYERDTDNLRVGWSRNIIGGVSDAAGNDAIVEAVGAIPSADGTREELWMIVKRYINGATHRYIEYLTKFFTDEDDQKDAIFVDSSLTFDNPKTITAATRANPVVITSVSHGFSNGDTVIISDVAGMTELNGNVYKVANVATNTFEINNSNGSNIDGTAFTTYVSGGEVRKRITTVSGLFHLEGQSLQVLGDGAVQPNVTVSGGIVTLSNPAGTVQLGLGYNSDGQMLRLEAGAADGTALGKTRRTHRVGMFLHRTLGLKIGFDFEDLTELTFRTGATQLGHSPELFTGIISETIASDYDFENQFCWRQDQPLPGMILSIMPQLVTQDRG